MGVTAVGVHGIFAGADDLGAIKPDVPVLQTHGLLDQPDTANWLGDRVSGRRLSNC